MKEIIYRQHDAASALTGKAFLVSVAGIVLRMAIAQIVVNLLIRATGVGLLNVAFYAYCVWLLVRFMKRTVAAYVYTLKEGLLVLERRLGDSTTSVVEIPLDKVVSMRPVYGGERLKTTYRQVTVIDPAAGPSPRMRAAFALSLLSAHLARLMAGAEAGRQTGYVMVFEEDRQHRACVFRPDEALCASLAGQLGERFGFDERMTRARITTLRARALERAFPALYAYVDPLVKPEAVQWAREELARQKRDSRKRGNRKRGNRKRGDQQPGGEGDEDKRRSRRRRA